MILRIRAITFGTLTLLGSTCIAATAATHTFEAIKDFPITGAGDVPFYSEFPRRNSLAINAANENFRNKFARATMVFEGASGFFDITLTTLAELDGEAPYRVLINDVLVGSATNPEVTVDYTLVQHTFEHIVVPDGATISVESLANTNGKIAEGDGTAFARGRWTTLELNNNDAGTATDDNIDLSVSTSTDASRVVVGESHILIFEIGNGVDSAVATQPILTLTRPRAEVGVDIDSLENCTESGNDVICNLSEIPAQGSELVSLTLTAVEPSPSALLRVTVSADQTDSDTSNNTITLPLQIEDETAAEGTPSPVTDNGDGSEESASPPDPAAGETTSSDRSGGGASNALGLVLLALCRLRRRHRRA